MQLKGGKEHIDLGERRRDTGSISGDVEKVPLLTSPCKQRGVDVCNSKIHLQSATACFRMELLQQFKL